MASYWTPTISTIVECHIIDQQMCQKRGKWHKHCENHAYIRQLVQELIKWYFQVSVGHTCCLLFINQGSTNSRVFQIALRRRRIPLTVERLEILLGGIFFSGGIAQEILLIFRDFCNAQINIPYILNTS